MYAHSRSSGAQMSVQEKTPSGKTIEAHGLYIDGREVSGENPEMIAVRNPATGEVIAEIAHATPNDVDRAMKSARRAFESKEWSNMPVRTRARLVNKLADAFEDNLDELYQLETMNNG